MNDHSIPIPEQGEIRIVVLLGGAKFIGWVPRDRMDRILESFERSRKLGAADRTDRYVQASLRVWIAEALRRPEAERLFTDVLAAASLWLALNHWSNAADMRAGLDRQMDETGYAVITASIPDASPDGMVRDTAWAYMIGSGIHDGRAQLAQVKPGDVVVTQR